MTDFKYQPSSDLEARVHIRRTHSFFQLDETRFIPTELKGVGSYGSVRIFTAESTEEHSPSWAIRAPINVTSKLSRAYRYCRLFHLAYPDLPKPQLIYWDLNNNLHEIMIENNPAPKLPSQDRVKDWRIKMPVLPGHNAFSCVNTLKNNPQKQLSILHAVILAISELHKKNIIHGDIHLGNFLLTSDGENIFAKACDFDFSSLMGEPVVTCNVPLHRDSHLAPERRRKKRTNVPIPPATVEADIYSFAYTLKYFFKKYKIATPALINIMKEGLRTRPENRPHNIEDFFEPLFNSMQKSGLQLRLCYKFLNAKFASLANLVSDSEENIDLILTALEKVHLALYKAQTSFFKSSDLEDLLATGSSEDKILNVLSYINAHPVSRVAKAMEILNASKLNIQSAESIQAIHLEGFRRSLGLAKTKAYGPETLFSYTAARAAAEKYKFTDKTIKEMVARDPDCRVSEIAHIVGFDEPIALSVLHNS